MQQTQSNEVVCHFDLTDWLTSEVLAPQWAHVVEHDVVDHLVGRRKALGEAFTDIFLSNVFIQRRERRHLSKIVVLARAYVVLDDVLRDHDIHLLPKDHAEVAISYVSRALFNEVSQLLSSRQLAASLIGTRMLEMHNTYTSIARGLAIRPEDITFGRCALLGLPFDILKNIKWISSEEAEFGLYCARRMLFALQIADDYADICDDRIHPHRFNLIDTKAYELQALNHRDAMRAYASYCIISTMRLLASAANAPSTVQIWSRAVLSQFTFANETIAESTIRDHFHGDIAHAFADIPSVGCLSTDQLNSVKYNMIGGQDLSAEQIHEYATISALDYSCMEVKNERGPSA